MSRDPTQRFSDRVADYVRYRPGYPSRLVPLLRERLGLESAWIVVDIGSGTGLSTLPFLENGNVVYGVEPNDAMRAAAESALAGWGSFRSLDGTAEATGLTDRSVDLVACGQAFHWFDEARARTEFLRVLRPPSWTVLFWNTRHIDTTPFLAGYEELLRRHGTDYESVRHDRLDDAVLDSFFRSGHERHVLPNAQELDADAFIGRLVSSSYTPAAGDPRRAALVHDARALFAVHARAGVVRIEYDTEIYAGRL